LIKGTTHERLKKVSGVSSPKDLPGAWATELVHTVLKVGEINELARFQDRAAAISVSPPTQTPSSAALGKVREAMRNPAPYCIRTIRHRAEY
jgi:hypothetical protein